MDGWMGIRYTNTKYGLKCSQKSKLALLVIVIGLTLILNFQYPAVLGLKVILVNCGGGGFWDAEQANDRDSSNCLDLLLSALVHCQHYDLTSNWLHLQMLMALCIMCLCVYVYNMILDVKVTICMCWEIFLFSFYHYLIFSPSMFWVI